jgi:hypothetical protein
MSAMPISKGEQFRWVPGLGPCPHALARLKRSFPKPSFPMGEAWFMGEHRRMFVELGETAVDDLPAAYLEHCLWEIASGVRSFGLSEEWTSWFRYLLPRLVERTYLRRSTSPLLCEAISVFINLYWEETSGEYDGFVEDALATLGRSVMAEGLWAPVPESGDPMSRRAVFLRPEHWEEPPWTSAWDAFSASPELSASLLFCMRYLDPEELRDWAASLATISDPCWRAHLVVWLSGALDLLERPLVLVSNLEKAQPTLRWLSSHLLGSPESSDLRRKPSADFISEARSTAFLEGIRNAITPEALLGWIDAFAADEHLNRDMLWTTEVLYDRLFER